MDRAKWERHCAIKRGALGACSGSLSYVLCAKLTGCAGIAHKKDRALADPTICLTPLLVAASPNGPAWSGDFAGVSVLIICGASAATLALETRAQALPQ